MRTAVLSGILCSLLGLGPVPAAATLFEVTGSFDATGFLGTQTPPVDALSGSFAFLFDDTQPPLPQVSVAPLSAFAQLGSVVFDASNSEVRLFFEFGVLRQIWWGGLAGGSANATSPGTDDIAVAFFASGGGPFNVTYATADTSSLFRARAAGRSGSLTFRVVPEPGTALLVGLGLAGLALARRREDRPAC